MEPRKTTTSIEKTQNVETTGKRKVDVHKCWKKEERKAGRKTKETSNKQKEQLLERNEENMKERTKHIQITKEQRNKDITAQTKDKRKKRRSQSN